VVASTPAPRLARTGGQPPPVPLAATAAPPSDVAELRTNALGDSGRGQNHNRCAPHCVCARYGGTSAYHMRGFVAYGLMPNMPPWVSGTAAMLMAPVGSERGATAFAH
jgi:hypothetical protein